MKKILLLAKKELQSLFIDAAKIKNIPAEMIEKDFWVCVILERIFSDSFLQDILCFKGGTSLSKVFKVIERFSEDIDLILHPKVIVEEGELFEQLSKTKQLSFNKKYWDCKLKCVSCKL